MIRALVLALRPSAPLALPAATLVPVDVPGLEGADINQRFGTDPAKAFMPKEAVNSPRPPVYVVRTEDADSKPLPYFKIAPVTFFLFGQIAEVDGFKRGFNGNAGFVVT